MSQVTFHLSLKPTATYFPLLTLLLSTVDWFQISKTLIKIEEDYMRIILDLKTGIQVPLHTMYLDLGQVPALYKVKRFLQLKDQILEGCQNKSVKSIGKASRSGSKLNMYIIQF